MSGKIELRDWERIEENVGREEGEREIILLIKDYTGGTRRQDISLSSDLIESI